MKKFNISSKKLAIIAFTTIQILCVFIAAAFVLQSDAVPNPYYDALGSLMYICITIIIEWVKYRIVTEHDNNEQ